MTKTYYGTKKINAQPMTRGEYNALRGWELPTSEAADDAGYLVEYLDGGKPNLEGYAGYVTWTPTEPFEKAYRANGQMSFGHALTALQEGKRVARAGWNGAGQYVYLVPANSYPAQTDVAKAEFGEAVPYRAYLALKTAQGDVATWSPSTSDALANDWQVLAEEIVAQVA